MKLTMKSAATFAMLLSTVVGAQACSAHKAPEQKKAAELKCPVMGGKVADIKTASKSTYQGKTYYFCCAGCKPKFDKDPAKYVKKA